MTNTTKDFCKEQHIFLIAKFGTNLLKPAIFIPYSSAMSVQYFDNIFFEQFQVFLELMDNHYASYAIY